MKLSPGQPFAQNFLALVTLLDGRIKLVFQTGTQTVQPRSNSIKLFYDHKLKMSAKDSVFVPGTLYQPCLMFASKVLRYLTLLG
jgi:hypothetical protein